MKKPKVFLSYARENVTDVQELYDELAEVGVQPWMDIKDLLPGQDWDVAIRKAIQDADAVVVCVSTDSVKKQGYLQQEIGRALEHWNDKLEDDIYLIPVRLNNCEIPELLRRFQSVDLWGRRGFTRLLNAINVGFMKAAGRSAVAAPRFFYYVSQAKVEMLLPQLRSEGTVDARGESLAAMAIDLIERLQRHELILPVDEHRALAPSEFYTSTAVWRNGLFFFRTMVSTTVAYFLWRRIGDGIIVLAGSPDNIIGRRVARDGVMISSTGDAIGSLGSMNILEAIVTDEVPAVVLGGGRTSSAIPAARKTMHVERRQVQPDRRQSSYNRIYTRTSHIALALFCLDELSGLPEMNIETVFRVYSRSTARTGTLFEDLKVEYEEGRKEYPDLFTDDNLDAARTLGLDKVRTVYLGSPLYTAVA